MTGGGHSVMSPAPSGYAPETSMRDKAQPDGRPAIELIETPVLSPVVDQTTTVGLHVRIRAMPLFDLRHLVAIGRCAIKLRNWKLKSVYAFSVNFHGYITVHAVA